METCIKNKSYNITGLRQVFKFKRDIKWFNKKYKERIITRVTFNNQATLKSYSNQLHVTKRFKQSQLSLFKRMELHQLDVKSTIFHSGLQEEVYAHQPGGYVKKRNTKLVYMPIKALQGLRQAHRTWNINLDGIIKNMKFHRCIQYNIVYRRSIRTDMTIIGVYAYDLVITGLITNII